jgi:16S rRNA (guanine527-N7)-methyltransferase
MDAEAGLHAGGVVPVLTAEAIAALLEPYRAAATKGAGGAGLAQAGLVGICEQLAVYLDLILKWNARINLTAIREPEEIVRRHFGESLFVGARLGDCGTLLDYGSGAGFPGVPIQLLRPDVQVTLAESRQKKAVFLREVVRSLGLRTEVWADRVDAMPPERQFDVVAMRAVDDMGAAVRDAARRAKERVMIVGSSGSTANQVAEGFRLEESIALPGLAEGVLLVMRLR